MGLVHDHNKGSDVVLLIMYAYNSHSDYMRAMASLGVATDVYPLRGSFFGPFQLCEITSKSECGKNVRGRSKFV